MEERGSNVAWWNALREFSLILLLAFLIRTFGGGLYHVPSGSMETTMFVGEIFFADKLTLWFSKPQRGDIVTFNDPHYPYSHNYVVRWLQRLVWGPSNWTKRIIGVPGDRIEGLVENGRTVIKLNGNLIDEPYVNQYPLVAIRTYNGCAAILKSIDPSLPLDKQLFYRINQRDVVKIPFRYPSTPLHPQDGASHFCVTLKENEYWVMGDNRLGSWDSRAWGVLDGSLIHGKIRWRVFSIDSDEMWFVIDLIKHPIDFWRKVRWYRCFQAVH